MCNVMHFLFTCQHTLKRRRSSCKGTKHKVTATSTKAACAAEACLTIALRVPCCTCQHREWERTWQVKREIARTFLEKLEKACLPGVREIQVLVEQLEANYRQENWKSPFYILKQSVGRVNYSEYRRARSRLSQNVRLEDVVSRQMKAWADMDENDYDPDYVASTDPVHPVSTDYSHPLDGDDGSYVTDNFSPEDFEASQAHETVDFMNDNPWAGDTTDDFQSTAHGDIESTEWDTNEPENVPTKDLMDRDANNNAEMHARGPDTNAKPTSSIVQLDGTSTHTAQDEEKVSQVVQAFWSLVDPSYIPADQSLHKQDSLNTLLQQLDIAASPTDPADSSTPTKLTPNPIFTDGPSDLPPAAETLDTTHPTPAPPPDAYAITPRSSNSTVAHYDRQRRILKQRKHDDANKYYSDWLYISRCEMRAIEGPEGRRIYEVQRGRG